MAKFPFYPQPDIMDCGPTCIRMVAKHYGKSYSLPYLRRMSQTTRQGSSMLGMSKKGNAKFYTYENQINTKF